MSTEGLHPEPRDLTSEPVEADLVGDPTTERPPSGRTYDDETPAADLESARGGEYPDEGTSQGGPGLSGLDTADPGRHHV